MNDGDARRGASWEYPQEVLRKGMWLERVSQREEDPCAEQPGGVQMAGATWMMVNERKTGCLREVLARTSKEREETQEKDKRGVEENIAGDDVGELRKYLNRYIFVSFAYESCAHSISHPF